MKPHEVSTLEDLRAYEESLGIWSDSVGWADDRNVRREDGAILISEAEGGAIELTPWSMSGPPRTEVYPTKRSAMQSLASSRLRSQLQIAVHAREAE